MPSPLVGDMKPPASPASSTRPRPGDDVGACRGPKARPTPLASSDSPSGRVSRSTLEHLLVLLVRALRLGVEDRADDRDVALGHDVGVGELVTDVAHVDAVEVRLDRRPRCGRSPGGHVGRDAPAPRLRRTEERGPSHRSGCGTRPCARSPFCLSVARDARRRPARSRPSSLLRAPSTLSGSRDDEPVVEPSPVDVGEAQLGGLEDICGPSRGSGS